MKISFAHHENKSRLLVEMAFHCFRYIDLNKPEKKNEQTDSYFRKYESL